MLSVIWLLSMMWLLAGAQEGGAGDAVFQTPGREAQFRWKASVQPAHLSNHQRLLAQVDVLVDGADLAKRRGKGELLILVRITDSEGRVYREHGSFDLAKVEEGIRKSDVTYSVQAFVLPGDYQVATALYDTETKEHAVKRESLRVAPMRNDPLPAAWSGLPPVEFIAHKETPDSWYLPAVRERLHLPVETPKAVRLEVLVNLTPSERASASFRVQDRNLSALLPAVRAISEIEGSRLAVNVSLLDLTRRKVTFRQEHVRELDWPRMREALGETTPGSIDVKSLEDRTHNAQFFVAEVARLAQAVGRDGLVVVLSSPVEFETGQEMRPAEGGARILYIRYHAPARLILTPPDPRMMGRRRQPVAAVPRPAIDQLYDKLKPLGPELQEVWTAEDFRKVLAGLIGEISRL